jgi:hypothetical protein
VVFACLLTVRSCAGRVPSGVPHLLYIIIISCRRAFVCSDAGASLVSVGTVVGLLASPWPGCVRAFLCAFRLVAEVRAVGVCSRPFGAGSLPLGGCTAALLRLALARGVAVSLLWGGGSPCGLASF